MKFKVELASEMCKEIGEVKINSLKELKRFARDVHKGNDNSWGRNEELIISFKNKKIIIIQLFIGNIQEVKR